MFGTLTYDIEQKQQELTFVENKDPASALRRNRREKRHISCESCRTRKVRCSGQPSGCDRCLALSAECRYPGRDTSYRRERTGSANQKSENRTSRPTTIRQSSSDFPQVPERELQDEHIRDPGHEQDRRRSPFSATGTGGHNSPRMTPIIQPHMLELEAAPDSTQQQRQQDQLLPMHPLMGGEGSSSESIGGGFEEWLRANNFIDTLPSAQNNNDMEMGNHAVSDPGAGPADNADDIIDPSIYFDLSLDNSANHFETQRNIAQPSIVAPFDADVSLPSPVPTPRSNLSASRDTSKATPPSSHNAAPQQSQRLSPAGGQGQDTKDGCHCRERPACLLNELGAEKASSNSAGMDVLLGCFRRSMTHCSTMLECKKCTSLSQNNILLAMAAQYMSTICERIAMRYIGMQQNQHRQPHQTTSSSDARVSSSSASTSNGVRAGRDHGDQDDDGGGDGGGLAHASDMWFSTYHIETDVERMEVLQCLVTVQLSEFAKLVENIKGRVRSQQGHLVLLAEAEKRNRAARAMLQASGVSSGVGSQEF